MALSLFIHTHTGHTSKLRLHSKPCLHHSDCIDFFTLDKIIQGDTALYKN
uniref:Uncharacterized protein n=1 Tax=Anguilla anguilla TaxID=7936 RepID=A0A0E9XPA8_ANGAN